MRRRALLLPLLLAAGCGEVLAWRVPEDVAWVVLVVEDDGGEPVEVTALRPAESLAGGPVDPESRVLVVGYPGTLLPELGLGAPPEAPLAVTTDPCAPRLPTPTWARRAPGDGGPPVDVPVDSAPLLTAAWLPPRCAEGLACVNGACMPRVAEVVMGQHHACAREPDGRVACWGENQAGQVGLPDQSFVTQASAVPGLAGVRDLALGYFHTCALGAEGKVACFGANGAGQLGDGTTEDRLSPVAVSALEGATQVAAGVVHTCALGAEGGVWCWGENAAGQVGDGTLVRAPQPTRVPGLTGARGLVAGANHTCALLEGGAVECWGDGAGGELGPGGGPAPDRRRAVAEGAEALAAGRNHTCALFGTGEVLCWGRDTWGQLGGGAPPLSGPAVEVAAGGDWSCARLQDGAVVCWGANEYGQRGADPATLFEGARPETLPLAAGLSRLALGGRSGCGLDAELRVRCWGWNGFGQLGNGSAEFQPTPRGVMPAEAASLAAGEDHTCLVDAGGRVVCWGANYYGQLGRGLRSVFEAPGEVREVRGAVEVGAGQADGCARTAGGEVWCWGAGASGRASRDGPGVGPHEVAGVAGALSLGVGAAHACAVAGDGAVWCWGDNTSGQLGRPATAEPLGPEVVPGVVGMVQVSAGYDATCALGADGRVRCWGAGAGVRDLGVSGVVEVRLGRYFGCLRQEAGGVACFGLNDHGQLGDGTEAPSRAEPAPVVDLPDAVALAAGSAHACAVRADGSLWCWGDDNWHQLGDGVRADRRRPAPVAGLGGPAVRVACGVRHTVVFEGPSRVEAWGWNALGQLGFAPAGVGLPAGRVLGLP